MKVYPQRSRLPNVKSSLLIQFNLWSKSAVFHFLWNCECRKMLKQESPATSKWAQHSSLFQPRDLPEVPSGSPESVNRIQRPGLSVQLTTSPNSWLPMGKSFLHVKSFKFSFPIGFRRVSHKLNIKRSNNVLTFFLWGQQQQLCTLMGFFFEN